MTTSHSVRRLAIASNAVIAFIIFVSLNACRKVDKDRSANKAYSYSAEVLDKWMTLQLRLMRNATGIPNHAFSRHLAYTGVAGIGVAEAGHTRRRILVKPVEWVNRFARRYTGYKLLLPGQCKRRDGFHE